MIVGPNGCGRSNLLEAMRRTISGTGPRSLRGAGMEDVIFRLFATLFGVTTGERGVSRLVSVDLDMAEGLLAEA